MAENVVYDRKLVQKLNNDLLNNFPHLFLADDTMKLTFQGVSRLVMLDRYTQKDINYVSLSEGDLVICVTKDDPKFPTRGIGYVKKIEENEAWIELESEYRAMCSDIDEDGLIKRHFNEVDKPLELYFEQIAHRIANNLGQGETIETINAFYKELADLNLIPAGRVLYGAGSNSSVTYFNCFVMPFIHDSRGGISVHRQKVMEIMSRGGGVGTNGSTLRPKNSLAKGVNGKSSGSVSWLHDLSQLTHLVEQGGSRRGAQMIMLADWHPDIFEFIISKMQNPKILEFLINNLTDETIIKEAKSKLKFIPLTNEEVEIYEALIEIENKNPGTISKQTLEKTRELLSVGGKYQVNNPDFLSGANISVAITKEFMEAVENDTDYSLRFPDIDNYSSGQKAFYNEKWAEIGDVRVWEKMGYPVKTYKTFKAREKA